ncbi:hypothetical protein [Pseudohongiella acticola]|nr:hypothetical protein [Pseudohongiella acticola]
MAANPVDIKPDSEVRADMLPAIQPATKPPKGTSHPRFRRYVLLGRNPRR